MFDVLTATELALAEIRAHNLHAAGLAVSRGQQGNMGKYNPATDDWSRPCLPEIRLSVYHDAPAFLAWCDYLQSTRVRVTRGDYSIHFHLDDDRGELCWKVVTNVKKPASGPCLPGIKPEWKRNRSNRPGNAALITVDELRTTFEALGVLAVAA